MDSKQKSVSVERVRNGWVLHEYSSLEGRRDGYMPAGVSVARTPGELAQMFMLWATGQEPKGSDTEAAGR